MSGPTLCGVINKFPSRNDCAHLGDMCDGTGDYFEQYVEFESVRHQEEFLTVRERMRLNVETELTLEQELWLDDINFRRYEYEAFEHYDWRSSYRRLYRSLEDSSDCTCSMCIRGLFGGFDDDFDPYDDYVDSYDDWVRFAEPEDQMKDLVERYGDFSDEDDIFAGYGETDADIDRSLMSFSSSGRFSYRFRGLSLRKQEALHQ